MTGKRATDDLQPTLTVVIPTLNAASFLSDCLASIHRQRGPSSQGYEIVVADGGSTDSTRSIAIKAGARVIANPLRKAEPGVAAGVKAARGHFITVMAADNRMQGEDFMQRVLAPFRDPQVVAAFPRVVSTKSDGFINRYFNRYSDPFNHFVYGSMGTSVDLMLSRGIEVFQPTLEEHPLLAVAQGCTFRAGSVYQGPAEDADDVLGILNLVEPGAKFALVRDATIEHHHVAGLRGLYKKYWHRTYDALEGRQGYIRRAGLMTRTRKLRQWLWIPYSATLIAPAAHGVYLALRYRDPIALYHPVLNVTVFAAVLRGLLEKAVRPTGPDA